MLCAETTRCVCADTTCCGVLSLSTSTAVSHSHAPTLLCPFHLLQAAAEGAVMIKPLLPGGLMVSMFGVCCAGMEHASTLPRLLQVVLTTFLLMHSCCRCL